MRFLITLIISSLFALNVYAFTTGDLRAGLSLGRVGLLQDVGNRSGNASGLGGQFNYANSEDLMFEIGYLKSAHKELNHTEVPMGFNYYFSEWQFFKFYLSLGVCYISNVLTDDTIDLTSSGFGAYGGGGFDIYVIPHLVTGLQTRYVKGFEQTVQRSNGEKVASLQDNFTLMFRVSYELNFEPSKF